MTRFTARLPDNVFTPVAQGLTPLERAISTRTLGGRITYYADNPPSIIAPLKSVADAVESAYILTAKEDLPKVTEVSTGFMAGKYYKAEGLGALSSGVRTADMARKYAAAWLAVAAHLEREEKAKAAEEAKAKAVADAAARVAESARTRRLDELADEWFGEESYDDLGPNKAAAIQEIYRLETKLNEQDKA